MSIERKSKPPKDKETMILFFEGYKTEIEYFNRINPIRSRLLGESMHLIIEPMGRDQSKESESHPFKVHRFMLRYKKWVQSNGMECHYDLFLTKYLYAISIQIPKLGRRLYYKDKKSKKEDKYPNFNEYKVKLKKCLDREKAIDERGNVVVDTALKIVENAMPSLYSPNYSYSVDVETHLRPKPVGVVHYGMLVDRDQGDFFPDQVKEIKRKCERYGDKLIITNPNFELWLSLHINEYDKKEMLSDIHDLVEYYQERKDKVPIEDRKYVKGDKDRIGPIGYLRRKYPDYDKATLGGIDFINEYGLETAIKNLKKYHQTKLNVVMNELSLDDTSFVGSNILDIILW